MIQLKFLANPKVREDLKLTEQQVKEADSLKGALQTAISEKLVLNGGGSVEDLQETYQGECDELDKEFAPKLAAILSAGQVKRLGQIELQLSSPKLLLREDVAKTLKLTEDQKEKIKAIWEEANDKMGQIAIDQGPSAGQPLQDGKPNPEMQKVIDFAKDRCLKLLDQTQHETWKGMVGPELLHTGTGSTLH